MHYTQQLESLSRGELSRASSGSASIVIAVNESNGRLPVVSACLEEIERQKNLVEGKLQHIVFVEWGAGLSQANRDLLLEKAGDINVEFAKANPKFSSAGSAFNAGVEKLAQLNGGQVPGSVMKLDDDTIPGLGTMSVFNLVQDRTHVAAPYTLRVADFGELKIPSRVNYLQQSEKDRKLPLVSNWQDHFIDGRLDFGMVLTTFCMPSQCNGIPNENGLVLSKELVNTLLTETKQVFDPERKAGEGLALYTICEKVFGARIVVDPSHVVFDRPVDNIEQRFAWGQGDYYFAEELFRRNLLHTGITEVSANSAGQVNFRYASAAGFSIVRFPERLRALHEIALNSPNEIVHSLPENIRGFAVEALREISSLDLGQLDFAASKSPYQHGIAFTDFDLSSARATLAHMSGHFAAAAKSAIPNARGLILAA